MTKFREAEEERDSELGEGPMGILYTECAASLEFVEGWSWPRILLALAAVNTIALAVALCWIFLGNDLSPWPTGYRDAGERVTGGAVMGVFVLLVEWTWFGGWLLLSSLVG
jgi:ABC-type Fe3+-siderophore transport system permease subunit